MIKQIQKPIPFAEFLIKSQHYDWYKNKACCVDGCTKPACYAVNGHFYCDNHGVPSMQSLYVDLLKRRCKAAIRVELVSDHTNKEYPDYVQQAIDEYSTTPYTGKPKIVGLLTYVPDGKTPSVKELAECIMQNPPKVRYVTQGYTLQETAEILERVIPTLEPGEMLLVDYANFLIPPGKEPIPDHVYERLREISKNFSK